MTGTERILAVDVKRLFRTLPVRPAWVATVCALLVIPLPRSLAQGTGGTITQSGTTYTHVFYSPGTFTAPAGGLTNVKVLIVAGGGGGAGGSWSGGGGGAGGVLYYSAQTIAAGSYAIAVGNGGAVGASGQNSTAFGYTAVGGGAGGAYGQSVGGSGGSGGGGPPVGGQFGPGGAGTSGQGNSGGGGWDVGGGTMGGGGGGASTAGSDCDVNNQTGGNGGSGVSYTLGGTAYVVGGGGGGGGYSSSSAGGLGGNGGGGSHGQAGTANTGGGGGGTQAWSGGGAGGSGLVVITYTSTVPPTVSIVGGNNQSALADSFDSAPLDVAVWDSTGTQPLVGTSITFTVQSGGGMLATTNSGSPTLQTTLTLTTDVDGTAQAYYKQPATVGVTSQITTSSGGASVAFTTTSVDPSNPPPSPAWVHATSSTPTSIAFSWATVLQSSGGAAISGYNIYRNGTLLNTSGPQVGTSYTDTTAAAGTTYTYTVKAVDTSGTLSNAATLNVSAPPLSTTGTFEVSQPNP